MSHRSIFSRFPQAWLLRPTLLSTALLDEAITGFLTIGLPLASNQLGLNYTQVGLLFTAGALSAMLLEPIINLLSDHGSKRFWIAGGLLILAAGFGLIGSAHHFLLLLLAFVLIFPAGSAAVGLSQAALIDQNPQESDRTMTRWTLISSVGDLLAPLIVPAIIILPGGWALLCRGAALLWLGAAPLVWSQRFPAPYTAASNDAPATRSPVRLLDGLREALRDPVLLRWAALAVIPTMIDEVFVTYATFYLRDVVHASSIMIGLLMAIHMIGAMLGLFTLDRFLLKRIAPQRLLFWLACLVLLGMIGFLSIHTVWLAALALFVISVAGAGWYPIAKAQAYARLPGRSGTVRAVVSLGAPFEVALPGIVGFVAGSFGVTAGIALLGLAPLLMLCLIPGHTEEIVKR